MYVIGWIVRHALHVYEIQDGPLQDPCLQDYSVCLISCYPIHHMMKLGLRKHNATIKDDLCHSHLCLKNMLLTPFIASNVSQTCYSNVVITSKNPSAKCLCYKNFQNDKLDKLDIK